MSYQVITCPNCNGAGCATCNQTGKVKVDATQLQKLKSITQQLETKQATTPSPVTQNYAPQSFNPTLTKKNTNLAGIIAFSLLSLLASTAAASWYFLKTLKPFFGGFISILIIAGTRFAWSKPFFQPQEPDDFISAIKKIS